jgi:transposase-like protein
MLTRTITVKCPFCGSELVRKHGHTKTGKQVYDCLNTDCKHKNFVEEYSYKACNPETRNLVLIMSVNGSGTRAIARSLDISKDTVTSILKKTKIGWSKSTLAI